MTQTSSRIGILGAGAIGSVLGAFLRRAGEDVTLIGRPGHLEAIRRDGLQVDGVLGSFTSEVATSERLDFTPDYTFLAVKSQDVSEALRENQTYLKDTTLVTFQNGVRGDELAAEFVPRGQIVSAVVNISASYLEPGKVTVVFPGSLVIGRPFGENGPDLNPLAGILNQAAPTRVSSNVMGAHWLKLIFNLNNAFPALLDMPLHEIYEDAYLRELAARVMQEGLRATRRAGIRLASLPEASVGLFRILGILPPRLAGWLVASSLRRIQSEWPQLGSTLQSLRRGRPTEVDYLNGEIVRLGERTGGRTPLNAAVVRMVHQVEKTRTYLSSGEIRAEVETPVEAR